LEVDGTAYHHCVPLAYTLTTNDTCKLMTIVFNKFIFLNIVYFLTEENRSQTQPCKQKLVSVFIQYYNNYM